MPWKNDQVSEAETERIIDLAKKCLEVNGDFVELGCYKGDTSLLLEDVLRDSGKKLWIYDSFEGLPEKGVEDESELGRDFQKGVLGVTKREVKERFLRAGLPVPVIKKAWFSELKDDDLPKEIVFAFLDGDLYESIKDSLRLVGDRVVPGGVILVHDYNNPALPGVARAVDEWMRGRTWVKQEGVTESLVVIRKCEKN
ncbi:class I SAM-dependent methyltransferase [Candidatus Saccharibacteria bacterium]|nr:class I SAM-dependent methyltransferase [Candidatus Saccharibacteria bacterium]